MELSSHRFKAIAVSAGLSFWFLIITLAIGIFSVEIFIIFVVVVFSVMQILSKKLSNVLDIFAIYNTKILLSILFATIISTYGILFRLLRIDLLRLKKQSQTYWLNMEQLSQERDLKEY